MSPVTIAAKICGFSKPFSLCSTEEKSRTPSPHLAPLLLNPPKLAPTFRSSQRSCVSIGILSPITLSRPNSRLRTTDPDTRKHYAIHTSLLEALDLGHPTSVPPLREIDGEALDLGHPTSVAPHREIDGCPKPSSLPPLREIDGCPRTPAFFNFLRFSNRINPVAIAGKICGFIEVDLSLLHRREVTNTVATSRATLPYGIPHSRSAGHNSSASAPAPISPITLYRPNSTLRTTTPSLSEALRHLRAIHRTPSIRLRKS